MWANAERDGRPAECRWRPLFNAAVWLTPTTTVPCSNTAGIRNPLKLAGVSQTNEPISAASGRSSPHCKDVGRYCCLTSFFPIVDTCLSYEDYSLTKLCDGAQMANFWRFLRPVFSASRVQQVSDMHPKFALRPHHVWKYGRHPICVG